MSTYAKDLDFMVRFRMSTATLRELDKAAERHGSNRSALIREAIATTIEQLRYREPAPRRTRRPSAVARAEG